MQTAFVSQIPTSFTPGHQTRLTSRPRGTASRNIVRCTQVVKPPSTAVPNTHFRKPKAKPRLAADGDTLESTPYQKTVIASFIATSSAVALKVISQLASPEDALVAIAAVGLSYLFTDLAVGIYHHAVDNYGSPETPVFGYQIAAFQGHHSFPWTITARGVANNLYRLTYPAFPQLLLLLALPLPAAAMSFYASFLAFIVLSQETHRQAHMTRAAPWVKFLQETGLILSQKAHGAHHRAPPSGAFEGNYCILSGIWNHLLDSSRYFRLQEALVFRFTKTEPICWSFNNSLREEALAMLPKWLR